MPCPGYKLEVNSRLQALQQRTSYPRSVSLTAMPQNNLSRFHTQECPKSNIVRTEFKKRICKHLQESFHAISATSE